MAWPFGRRNQQRSAAISVSDPAFAAYFGLGGLGNYSGVVVGEHTALGLSAVWRAVSLISETIASLPAHTLRVATDGTAQRVPSFLDDPGAVDGYTPFEFWETVLCHLLLHGDAFLMHRFNGGGGLAGLVPVHPLAVTVRWDPEVVGGKRYEATLADGTGRAFTTETMTQIMGKSLDGLRGLSPIAVARNSLGTAVAGDRAAAKMFADGPLTPGILTPEEDVTDDEAREIKESLNAKLAGWENAAAVAVVNRRLRFTPWSMSMEDAQFLQSRQFQIEEIARWYGIPPFALMQTEKQTSWGTGIESQQRGLARTVLAPWTRRIEQRLSRLLPSPRLLRFDFSELERATPAEETRLLIEKVAGGLMTRNEARAQLGMGPVTGGDVLVTTGGGGAPESDSPPLDEGGA